MRVVTHTDVSLVGAGFFLDEDNMASDNATKVPSQQSVKAYVDAAVVALLDDKGNYNASTNTQDLDTAPSGIKKGDTYLVSVAGTFFAEAVQVGDWLRALQDNPTTIAHWGIANSNINPADYATAAQGATADAALPKAGGTMSGNIAMSGAQTVDGQDVSADGTILDTIKIGYVGQNLQTGTSYTLVLTDAGEVVDLDNASAIALTIPPNSGGGSVAFAVNTRIDIVQYGAGQVTVGITTDTLRGLTKTPGQYKAVTLWKRASTEWIIFGGVA
jgi:hypothetical protein